MTSYRYLSDTVVAKIDDDGLSRMSCSIENPEFMSWIAEGNTPEPADPLTPTVPAIVTMRQARLALLQTGMLASVNAAVAAADEATKITWEFSSEVQRNNALVSTLAAALNLTSQQLDDLFTLAATL